MVSEILSCCVMPRGARVSVPLIVEKTQSISTLFQITTQAPLSLVFPMVMDDKGLLTSHFFLPKRNRFCSLKNKIFPRTNIWLHLRCILNIPWVPVFLENMMDDSVEVSALLDPVSYYPGYLRECSNYTCTVILQRSSTQQEHIRHLNIFYFNSWFFKKNQNLKQSNSK